jgi:thymidylate synthase
LEQEVKKLLEKNVDLEKSIHELNNLISNEEEEIAYRENESETLEEEVKKLI